MRTLALAALAVTLTAGAAAAQTGSAAGGPLGDYSRRNGIDPWGTTYSPPGVLVAPGIAVGEPEETGTIFVPQRPQAPGMVPGTPAAGKGSYSGGPRGEMMRREGVTRY